jgi:redox-sensitive bicupin YhaK (pirin superfamily)
VVAGLTVLRALPTPHCEALGPFVFLDHIGPARPPGGGVPAHPHAGIEVITYLLDGGNEHRDSFGNRSVIENGGAQWIGTGRGMVHAEYPRGNKDGVIHGVQLWLRQPAERDSGEPRYAAVSAKDIPQADIEGGRLRLLSGSMPIYFSGPGPLPLTVAAELLHATIEPGGSVMLPLKKSHEMGVYTLSGAANIGARVTRGELALLHPASSVTIANDGPETLDFLLLGGEPSERPLFFRGPFVFNAREALDKAYADFASGRMGSVDGVPF